MSEPNGKTAPIGAIFGCVGASLTADETAFFRDANPWGFILFSRNIRDGAQLRALTAALRDTVGRDAPILIDQEGGRVQRARPPLATAWAPAGAWTARGLAEPVLREALHARYLVIAAEMRALGLDVVCAPLGDLALPGADPIIGDRAYGADAEAVGPRARAVLDGLMAGGALGVVKHLPGHGRAAVDSHVALPVVEAARTTLEEDFRAFRPIADAPLGMTAHVVYTAFDATLPATLSRDCIERAIRAEIGFRGALMTDDLAMGALSGAMRARAEASFAAGCDLALHCSGDLAEMRAVAEGAPRLAGAAAARAAAAIAARPSAPAEPERVAAARARLAALDLEGGAA